MLASNARTESEVRFAKAQKRKQDASKALTEAEQEAKRVTDNTARLRALRLARDAADATAAAEAPVKKKTARKSTTKKA